MMMYLEGEEIPVEDLKKALRKATIDNKLVPQNEWNDRILTDGNKITIIRATFGG